MPSGSGGIRQMVRREMEISRRWTNALREPLATATTGVPALPSEIAPIQFHSALAEICQRLRIKRERQVRRSRPEDRRSRVAESE